MGYTIYWDYPKEKKTNEVVFPAEFVAELKDILKTASKHKIQLSSWEGEKVVDVKSLLCTDGSISFNGVSPESCETFVLQMAEPTGILFDCCKTRGYPYTAVCMWILDTAKKYGIIEHWSSDGGPEDEECLTLYKQLKGEE